MLRCHWCQWQQVLPAILTLIRELLAGQRTCFLSAVTGAAAMLQSPLGC